MKTLDKSKPYGEICGVLDEFPQARYEQGGSLYDMHGALVEKPKKQREVIEID